MFHRLPTVERAYGVKALAVDGTQFLAVARWRAESSLVFRWNGTEFELFQEVPSKRVRYLIIIFCLQNRTCSVSIRTAS